MPLSDCEILNLPKLSDPRGNLSFVENYVHIPFSIERVYYLYDVPGGSERGSHAHYELRQLLLPISGSFDVVLDDGKRSAKFTLNNASQGLYICPLMWRTLENFSIGSVCLVLASTVYDDSDYIRDYDEFMKTVSNIKC